MFTDSPPECLRMMGPGFDASGFLQGFDQDGAIQFETLATVAEGKRVCFVSEELYAAGSVKYCVNRGAANVIGVTLTHPERRRHARFPANLGARMKPLDEASAADPASEMDVTVVDTSECGIGMVSPCAVPAGANVQVTLDYGLVFATVRSCVPRPEGTFRIGVEIATTIFKADSGALPIGC